MIMFNPADYIILALDDMDRDQALMIADRIPDLSWVKVGLELFTSAGPKIVRELSERRLHIFLDLKFHDIPATMAGACRSAARLGCELITVHASAGVAALRQAQAAAEQGAADAGFTKAPTLLAVTVLTSWSQTSLASDLLIESSISRYVMHLAALAADAGVGGCVCSPLEVADLRAHYPDPFELVTPGIRPADTDAGDQARVLTPSQAVAAGASRLVIGRPITKAVDPASAFQACCAELSDHLCDSDSYC